MCPVCRHPLARCTCRKAGPPPGGDGVVRVRRETAGRKGKGVTVVLGLPLPPDELTRLGAQLKKKCGSGGTVKDGVVEIQGDHCDLVMAELAAQGWTVKRAGG